MRLTDPLVSLRSQRYLTRRKGCLMSESIPYQCFISYTRVDNKEYDRVVERLRREVAGRFEATTGTKLEIFLDRDSIGWGEHWREKIGEAVTSSTLFIPIITMRYFNSDPCRDELSAFHSAAQQRGVTDLILPIILAGSDRITSEHSDELVQIISELNWKSIVSEFDAGYESSDWKRRISDIVNSLKVALHRAAERLASEECAGPTVATGEAAPVADVQEIEEHLAELAGELSGLQPIMERVAIAATSRIDGRDLSRITVGQRSTLFSALAQDLREPAADFGMVASNIEAKARQTDAEIRALANEFYEISPDEAENQLAQLRAASQEGFASTEEAFTVLQQLEKSMRIAAMASINLRRAISPMTAGLRSLTTAMNILRSWQDIRPSASAQ